MKKISDTETALAMFEEAAINHGEATEEGDYKKGNQNYDLIVKAVSYLKNNNNLLLLSNFFNHESESVQAWAASYMLSISEKEAIGVLERITKHPGIVSFGAEITLHEWYKGNLRMQFE